MVEIGMGAAGRQGYQNGYDDGLSEGERRGWEKAIEAAANKIENKAIAFKSRTEVAAAIRKLKKP